MAVEAVSKIQGWPLTTDHFLGQIRGCIYGENWSKSDDAAWQLLQSHPDLKSDSDLGRRNQGITIVLL